jgi:uncharacterized protein YciI
MPRSARVAALVALGLISIAWCVTLAQAPDMPRMETYQLGILRGGPAWTPQRTPAADSLQAGHLANIRRMANEGVLVGAGPFLDHGDLRGLFIFRADSAAPVRALAARDPAIQARRLALDLYTWYAPAGIGEIYARRAKQPDHRDSMITLTFGLAKPGPRWTPEHDDKVQALERAHVERLFRLMREGTLATAGPLASDSLAGVFVFRSDSATARRLVLEDPLVKAGRLAVEFHPWFCAYGVMPGDSL